MIADRVILHKTSTFGLPVWAVSYVYTPFNAVLNPFRTWTESFLRKNHFKQRDLLVSRSWYFEVFSITHLSRAGIMAKWAVFALISATGEERVAEDV